jgi:GT2 family glycosyltransferase
MVDVSVIIPYHRDRGYLFDAIESYEAQEFTGTSELILSHNPLFTLGQNFNAGVANAKGKYIKVLPDDDLLTPNCLQDLFDMAETEQADVVFADARKFHSDGGISFEREGILTSKFANISLDSLLDSNFIHGGTTLYRTKMFQAVEGFDESLWTVEEYEFHLRCLHQGYKFVYLPQVVFDYRIWPSSKSVQYRLSKAEARENLISSIKERFQ